MNKFLTEKKIKHDFDKENLATPQKTIETKTKNPDSELKQLALDNKTPITKSLRNNFYEIQLICQEVLGSIDNVQKLLEEAQLKIENRKIDFGNTFESPIAARKRESMTNFKMSEFKHESQTKLKNQAVYFNLLQKLRECALLYFKFQHFTNFQLKILEKIIFEDKIIVNGSSAKGKSVVIFLYLKQLIEETSDTKTCNIFILTTAQRIKKIAQVLFILGIKDNVTLMTNEIEIHKSQLKMSSDAKLLLVDSIQMNVENIISLRVMTNKFFSSGKIIVSGFYDNHQLLLFKKLMKWSTCDLVNSIPLKTVNKHCPKINVVFEEDIAKTITKFIKEKVDKKRNRKVFYQEPDFIPFCIVCKNQATIQAITEYANDFGINVFSGNKIGVTSDIFISKSIEDIGFRYKHLFITEFKWNANSIAQIYCLSDKTVHFLVSNKSYFESKNVILRELIDINKIQEITHGFDCQSYKKTIQIHSFNNVARSEDNMSFILYLQRKNWVELTELKKKIKWNIQFKSEKEFRSKISKEMHEYSLSNNINLQKCEFSIEPEHYPSLKKELSELKAAEIVSVIECVTFDIEIMTTYRKLNQFKDKWSQFMSEYNEEVISRIRKIDGMYALFKKHSSIFLTREKVADTNSGEIDSFRCNLENLLVETESAQEFDCLPYKNNYKKLDIVREFSQIINDNFKVVNSKYFSMKEVEVDLILKSIILDILKQTYLNQPGNFALSDAFEQKMKSMNVIHVFRTIMTSIEFLKKNIFK